MTAGSRMRVLRSPVTVRRQIRAWRDAGERVAFVPTMGFLHEGHLSLLRRGRKICDHVVMSIFVNPTQFGPTEDFEVYPRDLKRDLHLARTEGVDLCFTPEQADIYPPADCTEVRVTGLDSVLEGSTRPTHFAGVARVVLKLLNIVEPDVLVLGQKDAQQAVVLERMIQDLFLPVRVVRASIVRETDGLALSSRNVRLAPADRRAAAVLFRALCRAKKMIQDGERSATRVIRAIEKEIRDEPRVKLDYVVAVDARTLEPVRHLAGEILIPIAAYLGQVRLIDNIRLAITDRKS